MGNAPCHEPDSISHLPDAEPVPKAKVRREHDATEWLYCITAIVQSICMPNIIMRANMAESEEN